MRMNTYGDEERRLWILDDSWEKKKGEKCEEKNGKYKQTLGSKSYQVNKTGI